MTESGAMYVSMRMAARRLGISETALRKRRERDDWRWGDPPWNEPQLREMESHARAHLQPNRAAPGYYETDRRDTPADGVLSHLGIAGLSPLKRAELAMRLERTAKIKLERELLASLYHPVAVCQRRRVAQIQAVKTAFLDLPRAIAPSLHGLSVPEIESALYDRLAGICQEFARDPNERIVHRAADQSFQQAASA